VARARMTRSASGAVTTMRPVWTRRG
jgi:hypothetical protein